MVSSEESLMETVASLCQMAYRNGVPAGRIQYLMECEAETWKAVDNDETVIEMVEQEDDSHIDVLVDALHQLAGEADELERRNDVDTQMTHIIEGLRFQAKDVQAWLNEHYYVDPLDVVDPDYEGESIDHD